MITKRVQATLLVEPLFGVACIGVVGVASPVVRVTFPVVGASVVATGVVGYTRKRNKQL